jgi:hypothetical protein
VVETAPYAHGRRPHKADIVVLPQGDGFRVRGRLFRNAKRDRAHLRRHDFNVLRVHRDHPAPKGVELVELDLAAEGALVGDVLCMVSRSLR